MAYNLTSEQSEQMFIITNLKEMYESNNSVLTNLTHITNSNFNNDNITNLVNNLIRTNNEIKQSIMTLLNLNTNYYRQNNNNIQHNNRQHNYSNRPNYHRNRENYINNPTISNLFHTFFDPVEIFPTPSQIETATRVVRFGDIIRPLNSACPISLENFNDDDQVLMIRHCNHIFSNLGLTSWFRSSCVCPVCRYDIRNHVSNNTNTISDLSGNVNLSSNVLPSSFTNVERSSNSNELVELLFNNLLGTNISDISGNNLSSDLTAPRSIYVTDNGVTETRATDISGNNLLQFFFRY
jgi:hypothetical protein